MSWVVVTLFATPPAVAVAHLVVLRGPPPWQRFCGGFVAGLVVLGIIVYIAATLSFIKALG